MKKSFAAICILGASLIVATPSYAADTHSAYVEKGDDGRVICNSGLGDITTDFVQTITSSGQMKITCQFRNTDLHPQKALVQDLYACSIYDARTGQYAAFVEGKRIVAPNGNITLICHD